MTETLHGGRREIHLRAPAGPENRRSLSHVYEPIESIQVVNPTTIKFKTKKYDSNFLFNLAGETQSLSPGRH